MWSFHIEVAQEDQFMAVANVLYCEMLYVEIKRAVVGSGNTFC